jgi:hypothetical protein
MKTFAAIIALLSIVFLAQGAGDMAIKNGKLQNPLNANGQTITNVADILDANGDTLLGAGPGGGEANTGANIGTGVGIFWQKSGLSLQFKNVAVSGGATVATNATTLTIGADAPGAATAVQTFANGYSNSVNVASGNAAAVSTNRFEVSGAAAALSNSLPSISVMSFGAKGDGVTDDTTAVQNWANYICSTNIIGIVPAAPGGCYLLSSAIGFSNTFNMQGAGGSAYPAGDFGATKCRFAQSTRGANCLEITNYADSVTMYGIAVTNLAANNFTNLDSYGFHFTGAVGSHMGRITQCSAVNFGRGFYAVDLAASEFIACGANYNAIGFELTNILSNGNYPFHMDSCVCAFNYSNQVVCASTTMPFLIENCIITPFASHAKSLISYSPSTTILNCRFLDGSAESVICLSGGTANLIGVTMQSAGGVDGIYSVLATNCILNVQSSLALSNSLNGASVYLSGANSRLFATPPLWAVTDDGAGNLGTNLMSALGNISVIGQLTGSTLVVTNLGDNTSTNLIYSDKNGKQHRATIGSGLTWNVATETLSAPTGGAGDMVAANNLSDVDDVATARGNLGAAASATTVTIAGTGGQITSSTSSAQPLSGNVTTTLSLPSPLVAPGTVYATTSLNTPKYLLGDWVLGSNATDRSFFLSNGPNASVAILVPSNGAPIFNGSGLTNLNPSTAFPTPMLDASTLTANHHIRSGATTNLEPWEDATGYTNTIAWTHEGLTTNLTATFNGTLQSFTVTNGPDVFLAYAGANGSCSYRFTTNVTLHFSYQPKWLAGSNSVVTNGVLSLTSYGGTNATQLEAAMKENQ